MTLDMQTAPAVTPRFSTIRCGEHELYLHRYPATEPAWARLKIIHGYGEHSGRYHHFMQWIASHGVDCDSIDLRGHGRSTGRRAFVRQWHEYLRDVETFFSQPCADDQSGDNATPLFVLAHSHGALVAAIAAEQGLFSRFDVSACIFCAPFFASLLPVPGYKKLIARALHPILPALNFATNLRGEHLSRDVEMLREDRVDPLINHIATPRWFVTSRLAQTRAMADAARFTYPLLCLSGTADIVSDPRSAEEFFERAGSKDKSLYLYPSAVHELFRDVIRLRVFSDVLAWMRARA